MIIKIFDILLKLIDYFVIIVNYLLRKNKYSIIFVYIICYYIHNIICTYYAILRVGISALTK